MDTCKFCGAKVRAGDTCQKSPIKTHVVYKEKSCVYCSAANVRAGDTCQKMSLHKPQNFSSGPKEA